MAVPVTLVHSSFRTTCSATPRKPDPTRKTAAKSNWWAPIFGISSEPDYLGVKLESGRSKRTLFKGCLTEEKAKELRKRTAELYTFHDIMYHSSIASKLASDFSR